MEIIFNRVHSKKDLAISSTILAAGIGQMLEDLVEVIYYVI